MKKELIKLANHLDRNGKIREADYVDALLKRYAQFLDSQTSWGGEHEFGPWGGKYTVEDPESGTEYKYYPEDEFSVINPSEEEGSIAYEVNSGGVEVDTYPKSKKELEESHDDDPLAEL